MIRSGVAILIIGLSFSISGWGQRITFKQLPQIRDTLEIRTDMLPEKLNYDKIGNNAYWDFRSLSAPFTYQLHIKSANQGQNSSVFQNAQGVIQKQEGYEMYTIHTQNAFSIVGYNNYDFMDLGLGLPSHYNEPYPIQVKTYNLGDDIEKEYLLYMPISNNDVPNDILKELPYTPDSARYVMHVNRKSSVLAAGKLDLRVDRYTVVRESIEEEISRHLEIKNESIPWQDVTELFEGNNLFQNETIRKEIFWSTKSNVPVAELMIDPATGLVQHAQFASHPFLNDEVKIQSLKKDIYAYPNPTLGITRFDLSNLQSGFYKLEIINLLSRTVWAEDYYVDQNKTVKIDLSGLRKGTYFYLLKNELGETLVTKRLVILKP